MPKTVNGINIQVEWLCRRDNQRHNHPMVMSKTFNGITILNVYAEHIQRHKNPKLNVYGEHIQRHKHPS